MDTFDDVETMAMYPSTLPQYDSSPTPMLPGYDPLDAAYPFDLESFAGSDIPPGNPHPGLSRFPSNYDEAFSDVVSAYDQNLNQEPQLPESNPALDRDNKLLSFSIPTSPYGLLDYTYRRAAVSLTAQLNGMFFMADPPTSSGEDSGNADSRVAVTCYRRNLFSISGSVHIPRSLRYISMDSGEQIPIVPNEITLSATESIEGASVKLISVPFKSAITSGTPEERADKEPHTVPLDLMSGAEMDPEWATVPLSWKRLQFRASTANNGRRKELQQHFVIHIGVMATLATGQKISICDVASSPIVVRGRSPRNFQTRRETNGNSARPKAPLPRRPTMDSIGRLNAAKSEVDFNVGDPNDFAGITSDPWSWKQHHGAQQQHGPMTALPPDTFRIQPNDFFAQSSPDLSRYTSQAAPAPINLSLEDEESKKASPVPGARETPTMKKAPRLSSTQRPPSFSLGSLQSGDNDDATDQLYEYFPLGLDDWQEPVDAVYRPHVVHHINLPQDARVSATKNRSKRYFSDASP